MRKRDLGILLLAAFAVFFSLHHEGDFSFRESWYHLADEDFPIKYEADRLPPPLVADLNGDGKPEVLLPTHDAKIQVLQPPHARHLHDDAGFHEARVMADISLLPDNVRVASGRRPIAMAVGSVDRSYRAGDVRTRSSSSSHPDGPSCVSTTTSKNYGSKISRMTSLMALTTARSPSP
jgi:hypothetical protein